MVQKWNDKFYLSESDPPYPVFTHLTTHDLLDFICGSLFWGSHYLQSACFQLITGHAFHADYSDRFWPGARDNISCPHCHRHLTPTTFLLLALTHASFTFDNNLSLGITYPFSHQRLVQSAYASSFITLKCFYILCHQDRILHEVFPFLSSSQGQVPSFVNPICLTGSTIATTLSCYSVSCI